MQFTSELTNNKCLNMQQLWNPSYPGANQKKFLIRNDMDRTWYILKRIKN